MEDNWSSLDVPERIIAVAGGISSGKTTVSVELAQRLGYVRASFGDYVRKVVKAEGLEESRESLQRMGKRLIESGWREFCEAVVFDGAWRPGVGMVVDGIRHVAALDNIRAIVSPQVVSLIFISVDEDERARRNATRERALLAEIEKDSTESEVETLRPYADVIVDGKAVPDLVISQLLTRLKS